MNIDPNGVALPVNSSPHLQGFFPLITGTLPTVIPRGNATDLALGYQSRGAGTYGPTNVFTYSWANAVVGIPYDGAGTVTVTVEGAMGTGTNYTQTFPLLISAALTGTGFARLSISPLLAAVANQIAQDIVPPILRITANVTGTISFGVVAWGTN